MDIVTKANYIDAYTQAFNLQRCEDSGLNKIVYTKARPCPICGSAPGLYCDLREIDTKGFGRKTKYIVAGVVLCGCGRSSMYYDERRTSTNHTEQLNGEPAERAANLLTDTWNGNRPIR